MARCWSNHNFCLMRRLRTAPQAKTASYENQRNNAKDREIESCVRQQQPSRPKMAKAYAIEQSHIDDWKAARSIQQRVQSAGVFGLWPDDVNDKRPASGCAETFCGEVERRARQIHLRSIGC